MIDKKEDNNSPHNINNYEEQESPSINVEKLTQCQQHLEMTCCAVQSEIRDTFEKLIDALKSREKQLLRQVDVLQSQQVALLQSSVVDCVDKDNLCSAPNIHLDLEDKEALLDRFASFGKVGVQDGSYAVLDQFSTPYRIEEYQNMKDDHVNLYKSLSQDMEAEEMIKFTFTPNLKNIATSRKNVSLDSQVVEQSPSEEQNISFRSGSISYEKHTPHIHEWLQRIKAETETEPTVSEVEKRLSPLEMSD